MGANKLRGSLVLLPQPGLVLSLRDLNSMSVQDTNGHGPTCPLNRHWNEDTYE